MKVPSIPSVFFRCEDLKECLQQDPDLDVVFMVSEDLEEEARDSAGSYVCPGHVTAETAEVLEIPDFDLIYYSRDDLHDRIWENVVSGHPGLPDDEIRKRVDSAMAHYEKQWRKCILVTLDS